MPENQADHLDQRRLGWDHRLRLATVKRDKSFAHLALVLASSLERLHGGRWSSTPEPCEGDRS